MEKDANFVLPVQILCDSRRLSVFIHFSIIDHRRQSAMIGKFNLFFKSSNDL